MYMLKYGIRGCIYQLMDASTSADGKSGGLDTIKRHAKGEERDESLHKSHITAK